MIESHVIKNWTNSLVPNKTGDYRDVRYMVFRNGERLYQEIRDNDDKLIHTLELPPDVAIETGSFEVLLRYVLVEVADS